MSSGFDRLVAFASTELDKTRRSIEDVVGLPHPSRSASPDSGITPNVLSSTSSTSSTSQLDSSAMGSKLVVLPLAKVSPGEAISEKSSPPQTPSPSASPNLMAGMRPGSPTLKIPLKYQRQSKVKHYKKKFRDRKWEYDDYGGESEVFGAAPLDPSAPNRPATDDLSEHGVMQLKTSKFRPKGKDWSRVNREGIAE